MRGILENLPAGERNVTVLDMGATPEPFSRGTLKPVDVMLLVAEPYYKSLEAVARMEGLSQQLEIRRVGMVANKVRTEEQKAAIEAFCERAGIDLIKVLPFDDVISDADLSGRAPLDVDGDVSPGISALEELATQLHASVA